MKSRRIEIRPSEFIGAQLQLLHEMGGIPSLHVAHVQHDSKCPCSKGNRPITACSCKTVWLQIEKTDTAEKFARAMDRE